VSKVRNINYLIRRWTIANGYVEAAKFSLARNCAEWLGLFSMFLSAQFL